MFPFFSQARESGGANAPSALFDWAAVCDPQSMLLAARRAFRLDTREGTWTGAFLPDVAGALLVRAAPGAAPHGDVLSAHSRLGGDTWWLLKQAGVYAHGSSSIGEVEREARQARERDQLLVCGGQRYRPDHVLACLGALRAPAPRIGRGHFTFSATLCDFENPQLLALTGTVGGTSGGTGGRAQWRAFVLPVMGTGREQRQLTLVPGEAE